MYNSPYAIWSIWRELSLPNRLFVFILAVIAIYSIVSATGVMKQLHALKRQGSEQPAAAIQQNIEALYSRCANLRQLLITAFYSFGFLFFLALPNATITLGDGREFPTFEILNNFLFDFVYAANIFFVFLVLHLIQWITCSRVRACAIRFNA
jgi:hypothetical protein